MKGDSGIQGLSGEAGAKGLKGDTGIGGSQGIPAFKDLRAHLLFLMVLVDLLVKVLKDLKEQLDLKALLVVLD